MDDVVVLSDDEDEDEDEARRGARAKPRGDEKKEEGKKRKPEGPFSFRRGAKAVGSCPCCAAARADDAHVTTCRAEEATRATAATGRRERGKENAREKTPISSISSPSKRSPPPEDVIVIDDGDDDDASPRDASRYGASARKRQTPRSPARASAKTWQCGACTLRNPESNSNCAACDRWRFSRGAPVASRPTGFGVDD